MNTQRLYHTLPYPLRVVAASCRGYYLKWWRYGFESEELVRAALERESWSQEDWKKWQEERLAAILERAVTRVPYYREYWAGQKRSGKKAGWQEIETWPVLSKEILRQNPRAFVADDVKFSRLYCDRTSGTSGTPLLVYINRGTLHSFFALFEARLRRWHGIGRGERWAILGGQKVVPLDSRRPPYWVFNAGLRQLYLSTYHLSEESAVAYVDKLRRFAPTHMIVYPSSAAILASAMLERDMLPPRLKAIFSNAELLKPQQRHLISRAFRCPVINTYGMGEMVSAASECAEGRLHLWPEVGKMEILNDCDDSHVERGKVGRFIFTSLLNKDMPLIRYEIGDRGSVPLTEEECGCGKKLPLIHSIEGRNNDMVVTGDGRRIFWLNPVFYGLPVKEAQIIQETVDKIHIRYVPAPEFHPTVKDEIMKRLRQILGNVEVSLEALDRVPRGENGKFRAVVSHVSSVHRG